MAKYLDASGLSQLWTKITSTFLTTGGGDIRYIKREGSYFSQCGSGVWNKILSFTAGYQLQPTISFSWQPAECSRNIWADFNINLRSGDPIFYVNWKGEGTREIYLVGDGSNYEVWVKGNKYSYDPFGIIQVTHYHEITNIQAGRLGYSDEEPSGWTYKVRPTLAGYVATADSSTTSTTSTRLATTRTIWGQSFDGTGNVSGAISGATSITASGDVKGYHILTDGYYWMPDSGGTQRTLIDRSGNTPIFGYGFSVAGYECYYSGYGIHLYAGGGYSSGHLDILPNGNVGIGNTNPQYKLDINGSLNATTIYQNGVALGSRAFDSTSYLPLTSSSGQTVSSSSGLAPVTFQSGDDNAAYIRIKNPSGTISGYYGFNSSGAAYYTGSTVYYLYHTGNLPSFHPIGGSWKPSSLSSYTRHWGWAYSSAEAGLASDGADMQIYTDGKFWQREGAYYCLDNGNTYVTSGTGVINGSTITQVANADTLDGYHASEFSSWNHIHPVIDTHQEGSNQVILDSGNELYAFYDRGGVCDAYEVLQSATLTDRVLTRTGNSVSQLDSGVFNGTVGYKYGTYGGDEFAVYDLTLPYTPAYGTDFFWSFGNGSWSPHKMRVLSTYGDNDWKLLYENDDAPPYGKVGGVAWYNGYLANRIRLVTSKFSRISVIGMTNYAGTGHNTTYMNRCQDDAIYRGITPAKNGIYNLGGSSNKWANVYADNFYGNASSASSVPSLSNSDIDTIIS